ncbi:MAG: nascent polypeptide-associated complex protein [Candidatus Aenigmarchaeota archaeon]|nr:nascent polypeptide-associated complex protein [Candidatus Aenigmarchaeota archaeon]
MKIDPRQMERLAKQMGMQTESIEAEVVIIRTSDRDIVIEEPNVAKVRMMGQESFQITGKAREEKREDSGKSREDDLSLIIDQAGCTREEAEQALKDADGDLAQAILKLKGK